MTQLKAAGFKAERNGRNGRGERDGDVVPQRILLVCTQRIGDVLLITPLARTLKHAWPKARLDVLVLPGTQGALTGNPDIDEVIALPQRVSFIEKVAQLRRLWRRYDLAVSPLPTDRARLFCWAAGRHRIGLVQPRGNKRLMALLLNRSATFDDLDTHTVAMGLRIAGLLGIEPCTEVVPPRAPWEKVAMKLDAVAEGSFVVLHPYPKFNYKMWTADGWVALARHLQTRGLDIVLTGGPDAAECAYAESIARSIGAGVLNLAGNLSLGETAELIRRARLFVGPDTAVTHIAAATGTATLALFGPSNPVKWGPWPRDWQTLASPWPRCGSGRQGNVYLLQGEDERGCVPCLHEGCQRHIDSGSDCLTTLPAERVIAAANAMLDA